MKRDQAIALGVSMYEKTLTRPMDAARLLRPASDNAKLGGSTRKTWRIGPFKNRPLYSLTLEERATCPATCPALTDCYGNNMPFAKRVDVSADPMGFLRRLELELAQLARKHPEGFSIRLHVLGDFYSVEYVRFWQRALERFPRLGIYGYTHTTGDIADAIDDVFARYPGRFSILRSDDPTPGIRPMALRETMPESASLPVCPEQTGKAASCLDCGLCTLPNVRGVKFLSH